jgi:general secretion pathway protein H
MEAPGRRDPGFTLIEMIVVIAVMGLIAGLVMTRQQWHSKGLDLDITQRALTGALRLARSRAVAQDRIVSVITGPAGFSVDGGPPGDLPAQQTISPGRIVFMPDGGSSGGQIAVTSPHNRFVLNVDWLTGRVTALQPPAP